MIDLKKLREDPDKFRVSLGRKRYRSEDLERVIELDRELRQLKKEIEELRASRNSTSKKIPQVRGDEKKTFLADLKRLSTHLREREPKLRSAEQELHSALIQIPNPPDPTAPDGAGSRTIQTGIEGHGGHRMANGWHFTPTEAAATRCGPCARTGRRGNG